MLPRSLSTKNRKRLLRDLFYTFDTPAGSVYDVTATSCWAQNGSPYGPAFVPFKLYYYYYHYYYYYYYYFLT